MSTIASRVILTSNRQQRLLAALLLEPNTVVPLSRLVAALWDHDPPATAAKQVRNCASALRAGLGASNPIVRDGPGYRAAVGAGELDSLRFRRDVAVADQLAGRGQIREAATAMSTALRLWRGPALDGLDAVALAGHVARLNEERINAIQLRAGWLLELGIAHTVIEELSEHTAVHPLHEGMHAQLMTALDCGGRRADALAVFHGLRRRLVDRLGVDPAPELQELHAMILAGRRRPTA